MADSSQQPAKSNAGTVVVKLLEQDVIPRLVALEQENKLIREQLKELSITVSSEFFNLASGKGGGKKAVATGTAPEGEAAVAAAPKASAAKGKAKAAAAVTEGMIKKRDLYFRMMYTTDEKYRANEKERLAAAGVDVQAKVVGPSGGDLTKEADKAYKILTHKDYAAERERIAADFKTYQENFTAPKNDAPVAAAELPDKPQ